MSRAALALILALAAWPVTSVLIDWIRHLPKYRKPGVGTQHIVLLGMLLKAALLGVSLALLWQEWRGGS